MRPTRMLVPTAAALAATALAWPGGPTAGAQEAEDKPKADGPAATKPVRVYATKPAARPGVGEPAPAKDGAGRDAARARELLRAGDAANAAVAPKVVDPTGATARGHRFLQADDAAVLNHVLRLRMTGGDDPHHAVVARLRAVANESCVQCHAGGVSVRDDETIGLTVVPADEALRAQLGLGNNGLVVTAVAHGSSGESGGVKEKDIIVGVEGRPTATVEDFRAALKAVGAAAGPGRADSARAGSRPVPVAMMVVRAGEKREVRVPRPGERVLVVGNVQGRGQAPGYWIGVSIDEADDTLREHLRLRDGGLVVTDVLGDSPAAKVGLAKNDVLIAVDGKPLKAPDDLVKAVQATKGEATLRLAIRRGGDEKTLAVKPERRKEAEVPPAPAQPFAYRELKVGDGAANWVWQVVPFLDAQKGAVRWATPAVGAPMVAGQPLHTTLLYAPVPDPNPDAKMALDALGGNAGADVQRLLAEVKAQAADRKAMAEWMKKAAAPSESLAKIDAQLRALEAQVAEIKRSLDDLKASLRKDSGR